MKRRLMLFAFLCSHSLLVVAQGPYEGHWSFQEPSGWERSADVEIHQTGKTVSGVWNYGSRERSWEGELRGAVKGSKLLVSRCYDPGSGWGTERPSCPNFGAPGDYFLRKGASLVWHTNFAGEKGYFVLELVKPTSTPEK